jgi:hypothetical protein
MTKAIGLLLLLTLASSSAVAETKKQKAARLARDATKQYQDQAYLKAGALFLEAYDLSGVTSQLRNAAKAFEQGSDLPKALELWSKYRDLRGVSRDERLEAVAHIDLIKERQRNDAAQKAAEAAARAAERAQKDAEEARKSAALAATRKAPEPPPPALVVEETPEETSSASFAPWIVLGAGGVLGIVSAVLWFVTDSSHADLEKRLSMTDQFGLIVGTSFDDAESDLASINRNRAISGVLLGTAITAVATGGIWAIVDAATSEKSGERDLFSDF